jgi:DNA-binding MarR family transcriptional regulator
MVSTKSRFDIFNYLLVNKDGVKVNDLVKLTNLKQPTVTFHINQLVKKKLVLKSKLGREVVCRLNIKCVNCPLLIN